MWSSLMMPSWRGPHLRRGPQKDEPRHPSQWRPRQPPQKSPPMSQPLQKCMEEAVPTEEPTNELAPAEVSMVEAAPTEESDEEPATPTAMVCGPAKEPDVPLCAQGERKWGGTL